MSEELKKFYLKIPKDYVPKVGSDSLLGKAFKDGCPPPPVIIVLQFEQTSTRWRERNKGPEEIIVPEYSPMIFCSEVLSFQRQGFIVEIDEYINDPS